MAGRDGVLRSGGGVEHAHPPCAVTKLSLWGSPPGDHLRGRTCRDVPKTHLFLKELRHPESLSDYCRQIVALD